MDAVDTVTTPCELCFIKTQRPQAMPVRLPACFAHAQVASPACQSAATAAAAAASKKWKRSVHRQSNPILILIQTRNRRLPAMRSVLSHTHRHTTTHTSTHPSIHPSIHPQPVNHSFPHSSLFFDLVLKVAVAVAVDHGTLVGPWCPHPRPHPHPQSSPLPASPASSFLTTTHACGLVQLLQLVQLTTLLDSGLTTINSTTTTTTTTVNLTSISTSTSTYSRPGPLLPSTSCCVPSFFLPFPSLSFHQQSPTTHPAPRFQRCIHSHSPYQSPSPVSHWLTGTSSLAYLPYSIPSTTFCLLLLA